MFGSCRCDVCPTSIKGHWVNSTTNTGSMRLGRGQDVADHWSPLWKQYVGHHRGPLYCLDTSIIFRRPSQDRSGGSCRFYGISSYCQYPWDVFRLPLKNFVCIIFDFTLFYFYFIYFFFFFFLRGRGWGGGDSYLHRGIKTGTLGERVEKGKEGRKREKRGGGVAGRQGRIDRLIDCSWIVKDKDFRQKLVLQSVLAKTTTHMSMHNIGV